MEQMIEFYAKKELRKNEGYTFIKKDYVFVPIIQTYLSVTKRDFFSLPLLDEIVLRLINEGVHDINELINVLGIERKLLEITLADLSVKDLIYCTTNSCSLMVKGRSALNELKIIQRSKECLKNIYLDPINEKVLTKFDQLIYLDKVYDNDRKLDADFEIGDVKIFRKNIENIKEIFTDETNIYNDKTKAQPSELISIDYVEKAYTKFVQIPLYIYISESGYDIDIMPVETKTESLLKQYKEVIISQIRNHKILKTIFTKYPLKKKYSEININENKLLNELSNKYYKERGEKEVLKNEIEKNMFTNRKLLDNEFESFFFYLIKDVKKVEINVNFLDDWCYNNDLFVSVLSKVGTNKLFRINYSDVKNIHICVKNINRTVKIDTSNICKVPDLPYISIVLDDKWIFTSVPIDIKIIDDQTHILKHNFYFNIIE